MMFTLPVTIHSLQLTGLPKEASSSPSSSENQGLQLSKHQQVVDSPEVPLPGYTYGEHEDISELNKEQIQELRAQVNNIFVKSSNQVSEEEAI